jgi:hypothetical protein
MPGHALSGDAAFVQPFDSGTLVAVIDALGHGEEAAATADIAVEALRGDPDEPVSVLMARCHASLRAARGVVASLASFDGPSATMTWCGVGNVEGFLFRAHPVGGAVRDSLVLRNGVVGYHLPEIRSETLSVGPGDLLIFATDGISHAFTDSLRQVAPRILAHELLQRYAKPTDDALVLAAEYRGLAR